MEFVVVSGLSRLGVVSSAVEAIAQAGYVTVPLCGPGPHTHGGVVCTSAGKRPLLGSWQHRREPLSRAQIEEHWVGLHVEGGGCNVGVSCGVCLSLTATAFTARRGWRSCSTPVAAGCRLRR